MRQCHRNQIMLSSDDHRQLIFWYRDITQSLSRIRVRLASLLSLRGYRDKG